MCISRHAPEPHFADWSLSAQQVRAMHTRQRLPIPEPGTIGFPQSSELRFMVPTEGCLSSLFCVLLVSGLALFSLLHSLVLLFLCSLPHSVGLMTPWLCVATFMSAFSFGVPCRIVWAVILGISFHVLLALAFAWAFPCPPVFVEPAPGAGCSPASTAGGSLAVEWGRARLHPSLIPLKGWEE